MNSLFQDWQANRGNPKGRIVTVFFRLAHALRCGPRWLFPVTVFYGLLYRVGVEWILGVELPWKTHVGSGLRIEHGQALVVNDHTVLGKNCTLRNGVTIGIKQRADGLFSSAPVLGDNVDVGANASLIGDIRVGNDVVIGAGAVVVKDVPDGATVVGNPARVIRFKPGTENRASVEQTPFARGDSLE